MKSPHWSSLNTGRYYERSCQMNTASLPVVNSFSFLLLMIQMTYT